MFLTRKEIATGLTGAWRIFKGDYQAMQSFDLSFEGFWRSFYGLALVVPLELALMLADRGSSMEQVAGAPVSFAATLLIGMFALVIGWFIVPLLMLALAGPLGIRERVGGFIIGYNWGSVLIAFVFAIPDLLLGLLPLGAAQLLAFFLFLVALRYVYMLASIALDASAGFAVALVIGYVMLGLLVVSAVTSLVLAFA